MESAILVIVAVDILVTDHVMCEDLNNRGLIVSIKRRPEGKVTKVCVRPNGPCIGQFEESLVPSPSRGRV